MGFKESIKYCFSKGYFNFDGRASRTEFWSFYFVQAILYSIGIIFAWLTPSIGIPIYVIIQVFLFIPNISVIIRRFHDVNISSAFILPFIFVAIVYGIAAVYFPELNLSSKVYMVILILYVFAIGVIKGSPNENRFGQNPLISHHINEVVNTHEFDDYEEEKVDIFKSSRVNNDKK